MYRKHHVPSLRPFGLCLRPVLAKQHRISRPAALRRPEAPNDPSVVSLEPRAEEANSTLDGLISRLESNWDSVPGRWRLITLLCLAYVLCNMNKVNLSVAILPIAQTFGWPSSVSGLIQSSFFWGYVACTIPSGYLCSRYGGRKMMPYAVGLWSLATAAVPLVGGSIQGLCLARAAVGMGEAVAPSAAYDMVARTVPISERSRAISFIYAGLGAGSMLGLFLSSLLIEYLNWEAVFVLFALGGGVWILAFEKLITNFTLNERPLHNQLTSENISNDSGIPVRAILRSRPVWILTFTHFCHNYFTYTMLTWLPSYFSQTLELNVEQAALISIIPSLLALPFAAIAGSLADKLIQMGVETTTVRKLSQAVAFLGPMTCLLNASLSDDPVWSASYVALSLGLISFSMAGLYCNHQDLSPKYSSFLMGLTNTGATIPGIVGVWLTGCLLDRWDRWDIALFFPSIAFFLLGTIGFLKYGTSHEQSFDDDAPFEIEHRLRSLLWVKFDRWMGQLVNRPN